MIKPNECYAYFIVRDAALDPVAVTARLRTAPTDAWKKGDTTAARRERLDGGWKLRSRLPPGAELEAHVLDVLMQMDANAEAFRSVCNEYGGGLMQLVGYFHEIGVGLSLTSDMVNRMASYGLALDQDFYYLYSHTREGTE